MEFFFKYPACSYFFPIVSQKYVKWQKKNFNATLSAQIKHQQ